MKIKCTKCRVTITVPEDKLHGKKGKLKIRCPECRTVLSVQTKEAVSERPAEEWYFAENGNQIGPVPVGVIQEKVDAGVLTGESLVWKAGLANWQPAEPLPELAGFFAAVGAASAEIPRAEEPAREPVESASAADEPPAPAAAPDEPPAPVAAPAKSGWQDEEEDAAPPAPQAPSYSGDADDEQGGGGGLFSDFEEPAAPAEPVVGQTRMLHSRRESSVLFSLDDLVQKGGEQKKGAAAVADDSGLIDIRQVALQKGSDDLFSSFSESGAPAAGASAAAPVVAMPILKKRSRWPLFVAVGGGGAAAVAASVAALTILLAGPDLASVGQSLATASERAMREVTQAKLELTEAQQKRVGELQAEAARTEAESVAAIRDEMTRFEEGLKQAAGERTSFHETRLAELNGKLEEARKVAEQARQSRLRAEAAASSAVVAGGAGAETGPAAVAEEKVAVVTAKESKKGDGKDREKKETAGAAKGGQEKKKSEEGGVAKKEAAPVEVAKVEAPKEQTEPKVAAAESGGEGKKDPHALLKALDERKSGGEAEEEEGGSSKKTLTTTDIMKVVNANKGEMRDCFQQYGAGLESATIRTNLKIAGSGEVTAVSISSMEFAGTALGNCIRKVQEGMTFPAFDKPSLSKTISVRLP